MPLIYCLQYVLQLGSNGTKHQLIRKLENKAEYISISIFLTQITQH